MDDDLNFSKRFQLAQQKIAEAEEITKGLLEFAKDFGEFTYRAIGTHYTTVYYMEIRWRELVEQVNEAQTWARRLLRERDELRRKLAEAAQRELAMSERIGELERALEVRK